MARRHAQPKAAFDPSKRLSQSSAPVRLSLSEAILQRATEANATRRRNPTTNDNPATSSSQLKPITLKKPGELERVIERITEGFREADLNHRAAIDQQVMECFRVASFLKHNWRGGERILGGEWLKFWGKNGRNGNAALRFVFKKVHADAKKASFYYRATRKIFEEGLRIDNIPARITASGGYQELADKNVKKPRGKTATSPTTGREPEAGGKLDHDLEPKTRRRASAKEAGASATILASAESKAEPHTDDQVRLVTVTTSDKAAFSALPMPCSAILKVELSQAANGELLMQIFELQQTA